jgi:hypothetical protein
VHICESDLGFAWLQTTNRHTMCGGTTKLWRGKSTPHLWRKKTIVNRCGNQKLTGKQTVTLINMAVALRVWRIAAGNQTRPLCLVWLTCTPKSDICTESLFLKSWSN